MCGKTTHMIVQVIIGNSHTCLVFTTHMEVVEISVNFHTCVVFTKQPEWDPSLNNFLAKLLALKELFTWYCPMTIRPLFEKTPVLDNNLNINALMTLTMMNKITRNVKWHKILNGTKCQMTQNVKWHKVSNDTKCQMKQNEKSK